jgi:hypothetical protein
MPPTFLVFVAFGGLVFLSPFVLVITCTLALLPSQRMLGRELLRSGLWGAAGFTILFAAPILAFSEALGSERFSIVVLCMGAGFSGGIVADCLVKIFKRRAIRNDARPAPSVHASHSDQRSR